MSTAEKLRKIQVGDRVQTTQENPKVTDWAEDAKKSRQWGVLGNVTVEHGSHGVCYSVRHDDGTIGYYDPTELEFV